MINETSINETGDSADLHSMIARIVSKRLKVEKLATRLPNRALHATTAEEYRYRW